MGKVILFPGKRITHVPDAARPFRIYNANRKRFLIYRYYTHKVTAMQTAHWIAKWLPDIGHTLEVIDVRTGKLHGQYTRRLNHVEFQGETLHRVADLKIQLQGEKHG